MSYGVWVDATAVPVDDFHISEVVRQIIVERGKGARATDNRQG
jgi:hypothetical protein